MQKARLKELYKDKIQKDLLKTLNLKNIMEVPRLVKIVLNVGVKEAISDSKALNNVMKSLSEISSQKPVKTVARKSIAGFKIRQGMPLGAMVTLRDNSAYFFLDKLINVALPNIKDFQGVSTKFDRHGNYNLGLKEINVFPEAENTGEKTHGMNVTIHTSTNKDAEALELLKSFGIPFKK